MYACTGENIAFMEFGIVPSLGHSRDAFPWIWGDSCICRHFLFFMRGSGGQSHCFQHNQLKGAVSCHVPEPDQGLSRHISRNNDIGWEWVGLGREVVGMGWRDVVLENRH